MLVLLSPAKKLDFESEFMGGNNVSQPRFLKESQKLIDAAKQLTVDDLKGLMKISDKLAELNVLRFRDYSTPFTLANSRPAIDAFKGDVYQGLDAPSLNESERQFSQNTLRILSGLYGLLRPLDLMQPYRLEMGIKFKSGTSNNLYQFWGNQITELLNQELGNQPQEPVVINLASGEYFKAVKPKELEGRLINITFKEIKNDNPPKVISFLAKKARGLMARYIIQNRLLNPEDLKNFQLSGYRYSTDNSTENDWTFIRKI